MPGIAPPKIRDLIATLLRLQLSSAKRKQNHSCHAIPGLFLLSVRFHPQNSSHKTAILHFRTLGRAQTDRATMSSNRVSTPTNTAGPRHTPINWCSVCSLHWKLNRKKKRRKHSGWLVPEQPTPQPAAPTPSSGGCELKEISEQKRSNSKKKKIHQSHERGRRTWIGR